MKLMSIFEATEGRDYILNTISAITQNSSVETADNGITQSVTMKTGKEF